MFGRTFEVFRPSLDHDIFDVEGGREFLCLQTLFNVISRGHLLDERSVAFTDIVEVIRTRFGLQRLVLVGDRGMITSARIDAIKELNDTGAGFGWITALRAPAIAKLAAEDGPLQMSLFDTHDLAEIAHPEFPGERLIACRNPALAAERTRKRHELLAATETLLAGIAARVDRGTLAGTAKIGEAYGKVVGKYKVGKHFQRKITDTTFTFSRNQAAIDAEARLDGIYVLRTSVPAADLTPAELCSCFPRVVKGEYRVTRCLMFECVVESPAGRRTFLGLNEIAVQTAPPFSNNP